MEKLDKLFFRCFAPEVEGRRKSIGTCDFYYKVRLDCNLLIIFQIENDEYEGDYYKTHRKTIFTYETNVPRLLKWIGIDPEDIEGLEIWRQMSDEERLDYLVSRRKRFYTNFDEE